MITLALVFLLGLMLLVAFYLGMHYERGTDMSWRGALAPFLLFFFGTPGVTVYEEEMDPIHGGVLKQREALGLGVLTMIWPDTFGPWVRRGRRPSIHWTRAAALKEPSA